MKKNKRNGDLIQILLNIVILGVFSIVENWLLFFYGQSWMLVVIFGVLMILVSCLLAINIFNCVRSVTGTASSQTEGQSADSAGNDKQIYALLYKQMKEIQKNQLLGTKAVLDKMSSLSAGEKEQIRAILQEAAIGSVAAENKVAVPEADFVAENETTVPETDFAVAENETAVPEVDFAAGENETAVPEVGFAAGENETAVPEVGFAAAENEIVMPEGISEPNNVIQPEEAVAEPEEADFTSDNLMPEEDGSGLEDLLDGVLGDDPNKELTPDEIAALFANIN